MSQMRKKKTRKTPPTMNVNVETFRFETQAPTSGISFPRSSLFTEYYVLI